MQEESDLDKQRKLARGLHQVFEGSAMTDVVIVCMAATRVAALHLGLDKEATLALMEHLWDKGLSDEDLEARSIPEASGVLN